MLSLCCVCLKRKTVQCTMNNKIPRNVCNVYTLFSAPLIEKIAEKVSHRFYHSTTQNHIHICYQKNRLN